MDAAVKSLAVAAPRRRGLTLIELLIGLVIMAIVASIAYPSFMSTIYKSRRSDGAAALTTTQQALERWRTNNTSYTDNLTNLKVASTSPDGHYTITVELPSPNSATGYIAKAEAAGKQINDDPKCKILTITADKGNLVYGSSDGSSTYAGSASPCWKR